MNAADRGAKRKLPRSLTLPSGRRVRLSAAALGASASPAERTSIWAALAARGVVSDQGGPVDIDDLALSDAHVLAAMVFRAGLVEEPEVEVRCHNCDRSFMVRPSGAVEPGPFVDGELDDPELDAPFEFERAWPLPPVFTASGRATSARLAPRTVGQARALLEARGAPLPLTRATVMALGVAALGKERRAAAIARALSRASDQAWTALGELWERAHVPERLVADVFCECGARCPVLAPGERAFDALAGPSAAGPRGELDAGFPSLAEFEAEVERARRVVYAARGVRNLPLYVDDGVPACDDGGEPLLGSYVPASSIGDGFGDGQPEIRLYYRTFQSEVRSGAPFDVKAEIRQTIDHEVEHHLFHLRGHDPMDAEERATIAEERARVVGRRETVRRAVRGSTGALRALLPLLVLLAVLAALQFCRG